MYYIEKWVFKVNSFVLYWKMRISKNSFSENVTFLCIILKNEVFKVNFFLFCIEKWGFQKTLSWKNSILMYYIEKWCFRSQFFCFVLKNEEWEFLKILSEKMLHSYVLYWKMRFLKSISFVLYWKMIISKNSFPKNVIFLCIVLKNDVFEVKSYGLYWKMRNEDFLKRFPKKFAFLCIILKKNEVFEVNSFVLYWKMRIYKNSFRKNSILMYYIEKWCFQSQFFCYILMYYIEKWGFWSQFLLFYIEKWSFLRTLFRKMLYSYVLYWKMMFLKSNLMVCIEKWGMRIS